MNRYNVSPTTTGWIPPRHLVMVKRRIVPKTRAIWKAYKLMQYENKFGTIERIHLVNLQGENNPKGVQKPFQKDHMLINATCIKMPTWSV